MVLLTVTRKYQSDFIFCIDLALDLPQTIAVFGRENTELFGEYIFRSSCPELFYEKGVLKIFGKFGKHLCWSLFLNKVSGWRLPNLSKKDPATLIVL